MWWEDLYEMYRVACNLDTMETNDRMKFDFLLHAGSKDAMKKWKDLAIPFPSDKYMESVERQKGVGNQMTRPELQHAMFRRARKVEKMTPEQRERYKYVKKRIEEHKKEMASRGLDY